LAIPESRPGASGTVVLASRFALHGIGLSDARYEARERSRGGKRQVIVKIADHDEVYVDGQRQ
jgi:hypothetical protein